MKETVIRTYSREEIQQSYDQACERIAEYDAKVEAGGKLSDFGQWCYNNACKSRDHNARLLALEREVYCFAHVRGEAKSSTRLVEVVITPID